MTPSDTPPVTILDDEESWAFLAGHEVGRLVTSIGGDPEIYPINFVVDGEGVVFRTSEGSKLLAITIGAPAAFEVDRWDAAGGTSVIARGLARELDSDAERAHAETLGLRPWVPTHKAHWVSLDVTSISGRRFVFGPEPVDDVA